MQILPFSSGAHAAADIGSMTILQFPEAPGLGIVRLGGASGGVCLDNPAKLAAHARACADDSVLRAGNRAGY